MVSGTISGSSTTNTYAYMYQGAKRMLEQADTLNSKSYYNLISCLMFSAYTLEAYFNHLGRLVYSNGSKQSSWDDFEKKPAK